MAADAGVFRELASGAFSHVQVEFFVDGLGFGIGFDADGDGEVVAFGNRVDRDEFAVLFLELHFGGVAAFASDDADDLAGEFVGFEVVSEGDDFDFSLFVDKEFEVRFDDFNNATTVWAGVFLFM